MFYKFQNIFFVLSHYLLKSFKFNIQQNQFIDLTIGSLNIFVNLYNFIPKPTIKALLPRNYDGMEYPSVTIIDSSSIRGHSNHLAFYSFIDYAIQYGINVNSVLERIIITRSFTAHQLANTILCKLPKMIQKYRSNIVIITDLFVTDEQLHLSERKGLLGHMLKSIHTISESIIVAVFSPVVIGGFRKVIDNKLKKIKNNNNKQTKQRDEIDGKNNSIF